MPNLQTITLIEDLFKEDSNVESGSKYFNPSFDDHGDLADRAEDNLKNRAIRQVLSSGQYKKYWLPVDKELNLPKSKDLKPESKFREFFQQAWFDLKDKVALSISVLQKLPENDQDNPHRVTLHAVAVFNAQDILNTVELYYSDYLSDAPAYVPPSEDSDVEQVATPTGGPTHEVDLINTSYRLAMRENPSKELFNGMDVYTSDGDSSLTKLFPTAAGALAGLVGLLPHGTKVLVELVGITDEYSTSTWDYVTVIEGPAALDENLIGQSAWVDKQGLRTLPTGPTVEELLEASDEAASAEITEEQQAQVDLVKEFINPAPVDISEDEVNPYVANANVGPKPDWTTRAPFIVVKNKAEARYEIVVELDFFPEVADELGGTEDPKVYKEGKKKEARKEGLRTLLRYFNRHSDEAYVVKLLSLGQGEMSQIQGKWADGNPNNRKIYYLVTVPSAGTGGFNYKSHEPAETLTIKEMVVERVIDFQYVFLTNKIQKQIDEVISVLKDTIKPGLDNYSGAVENKPDIDFQIKKLESFIPAIKEALSENNIKYREDKEDQIELGLDSELSIIYIRYGPEDGQEGSWKLVPPISTGN
jgi:hypothetical protein